MCDAELPNQENFPYPGNFPYLGFIKRFLHYLIPGLPYPGNFTYPIKASIRKSAFLFKY